MANKKPAAPKAAQKPKPTIPYIDVRVRLNDYAGSSNILATASANIGKAFAVHGIKVMDSKKRIFVSMPQSSYTNAEGETKYREVFHPISSEARQELYDAVMNAYEEKLAEVESEDEAESEDENHSMEQSM